MNHASGGVMEEEEKKKEEKGERKGHVNANLLSKGAGFSCIVFAIVAVTRYSFDCIML